MSFQMEILELASSRPDKIPASLRREKFENVFKCLQEMAGDRAALAELPDIKCSSKFAYSRITKLICTAIIQEEDPGEVRVKLCKQLCNVLRSSGDADLLDRCRQKLPLANLESIFSDLAKESGIPAMSFAPVDWPMFVQTTLTDNIASAVEMKLCRSLLQGMDFVSWEETVAPAMTLKLKAKPETLIDMVEVLLNSLNGDILAESKVVTEDLLPALTKQLKSAKEPMRNTASKIIQHLANASIQSSSNNATTSLKKIVQAVADTQALTQVQHRQIAYTTLKEIGKAMGDSKTKMDAGVISTVLKGICVPLSKEAKTVTEARDEGMEALFRWMVVGKRNGGSQGFDEALAYVRKPVTLKNGPDSLTILGSMIRLLHPDILEALVLDLWSDAKFSKGLEALIEVANKKSTSSSIPQVEGLIAVYICLIYASASSSNKMLDVAAKAVSAGSVSQDKTSFVYSEAMTKSVASNELVAQILPQLIIMGTKQNLISKIKATSSVSLAVSCIITHPVAYANFTPAKTVENTIQTLLDYHAVADDIAVALFEHVKLVSQDADETMKQLNATRQAREETKIVTIKGKCSPTASHHGMDVNAVRRVAKLLGSKSQNPKSLAVVLILMHIGSSVRTNAKQRSSLITYTTNMISDTVGKDWDKVDEFLVALADYVAEHVSCTNSTSEPNTPISEAIHLGSKSLITSLGSIAANFTPSDDTEDEDVRPYMFSNSLCTKELAPRLSTNMKNLTDTIEGMSKNDIDIYMSPIGSLHRIEAMAKDAPKAKAGGKGRRTEDEEWELQIKNELAKKKEGGSANTVLSAEDKALLREQDATRQRIASTVGSYTRLLSAIESLVESDIEIGNSCLPMLSGGVLTLAISSCPFVQSIGGVKEKSLLTLTTLAGCVYEIQEEYAGMMAHALVLSHRQPSAPSGTENSKLEVVALPSPCEPAATTIFEVDEFQEELSGPSFAFLFPVVRAALMGPRTTPGCEGALRILERHTIMLAGEGKDPIVAPLRTDMVNSVLELCKHDRAQTFVDPTPYETLVSCYSTDDTTPSGPVLSTSELAPLLDERGALGSKNCRIASMIALASIASNHVKLVKNNPLIENRIWLNCFDKNDAIRTEARKAWGIVHDMADLENSSESLPPPSPMYAIPLVPLLSNEDQSIAAAAAEAYAHGMAAHPKSVGRNIHKLCSVYIDSCPSEGSEEPAASAAPAVKATATPAKKPMGVPASLKKKTVKKSALQVAGIGQPKRSTKTKKVDSALLKPKAERTLDQEELESQFKTGPKKIPAEKDSPEKVAARMGILKAIASLTDVKIEIDTETLKLLTTFLMAYGIADAAEEVKTASRNALRDSVASYGGSDDAVAFLLPHLDNVLKKGVAVEESLGDLSKDKIPKGKDASDRRKEGAVVALGSVALHLKGPENASKIDTTVDMLLQSLKTPNEDVQASVADCLAKLMKKGNTQDRIEKIFDDLLQDCLEGSSAAIRRGSAYGMAAAVKGSGIAALKKYGIVTKLEDACASGSSSNKEGSLFAIELLCTRLGLLFEPYVIALLPSLLKCFGDGSDHVRKAASHCVSLIMSKLSAHGVKLVMPAVLTAFNDSAWRTKQASIHMLGSMSHLAPKQLASALPKVVPKLIEAFADTHPKVKGSAQEALNEITTVIRNPEISSLSPVLLKALTDPADNTLVALESLIATEFLHAIDAPSLALIVPILHRGLRDRFSASTKRYGALITGNICTMINDPRDFVPYLPTLIPDLKAILLDPIPDVRSISAKAFGSLTRGLGENTLPDLRPWLIETLRSEDVTSAERSGAAQGLTEVLIASGTSVIESVMLDDILPLRSHPSASTREGVLWVLTFLPPALGQGFTPMLDACLPALIGGLSDENEQVRDIGMRAGRVLIKSHGRVHCNKILPILQNGMGDTDHRIRLSSLMLMGDLLSMIGGTTVLRTDGDTQDDIRKAEKAQAQLSLALGIETRNRVLSDIYLARSDAAVAVRQAAIQVWKTVVSITARTLRQILPVLVARVVADLASGDPDKTEVAGKCLGDIVGKLGDSVLPEIIPVLRNSLYDGDNFTRRGVCVGLTEVIGSSTKDQIIRFLDIIVKVVQDALCDDDEGVRDMASSSFQNLYSLVGSRAMDEVVPALMVSLESSGSDAVRRIRALNGLSGILKFRSRELLPYIIPRLIQVPITLNHAQALTSIAAVTGDTIYFHFNAIIPALMQDLIRHDGTNKEREEEVRGSARSMFAHGDEAGVNFLISEIASKCSSDKAEMRRESCWMLENVIIERRDLKDFYEQVPIIIRELVYRLNDENAEVLKATHKALQALSTHVPAEELVNHVEFMRNLIASLVSDARRRKGGVGDGEFLLPGFNIPKGLEPFLPIYQRGILYGTPAIREASAAGLGEAISLTSTKFLAGPLIIKMTGPLLRIVGDRNPSNVKIAILRTLGLILVKGGPALRAFVPQFQTTFVKALSDPSRQVRIEAIKALGLLMPLSTRLDPLIKELVAGALGKAGAGTDSVGAVAIQTATLEALAVVLREGGKKAKLPDSIPAALEAGKELLVHSDEDVREAAAKVVGAACGILGQEAAADFVRDDILGGVDDTWEGRHGIACAVRRVFSSAVSKELDDSLSDNVKKLMLQYMNDDKAAVKEAAYIAVCAAVASTTDPTSSLRSIEDELLQVMNDTKERMEAHQAVANAICLCLQLADVDNKVDFLGLNLLNACLKLAMSGVQRVQFAFNDTLYVALDVSKGQEGLDHFSSVAMFEDAKQMKSVYSKVLAKMKGVKDLTE